MGLSIETSCRSERGVQGAIPNGVNTMKEHIGNVKYEI